MPEYADIVADPSDYLPAVGSGVATTSAQSADISPVVDFISALGYTYEPWQVSTFVTALRTKPFLILAGISGTGKTKLPQLVARATGAKVEIVPVRPDWTDSSDLLGYERLSGDFVIGRLLDVCAQAIDDSDTQYFFILDEMNVARVEYYFAEVLSLMENRQFVDGKIRTAPLNPQAPTASTTTAPPTPSGIGWNEVYLPSNVSIVGTVNMDETTHGFSRKVLDRAFVLELSEVDLSDVGSVEPSLPNPATWTADYWQPSALRLPESDARDSPPVVEAIAALVRANEALTLAQLQVGFRVRDEVALFCLNAADNANTFVGAEQSAVSPLDLCLSMKVLPRIQGSGAMLREVLDDLAAWTGSGADTNDSEAPAGFPRTHERLELMIRRLEQSGFTAYWI